MESCICSIRKTDKEGRVVLPLPMRDLLGIKAGDSIEIKLSEGEIILHKCDSDKIIDEKEMITVYEYAKIHNIEKRTLFRRIRRNFYKSAMKIHDVWYINKNEVFIEDK